jgi:hypothetical protein
MWGCWARGHCTGGACELMRTCMVMVGEGKHDVWSAGGHECRPSSASWAWHGMSQLIRDTTWYHASGPTLTSVASRPEMGAGWLFWWPERSGLVRRNDVPVGLCWPVAVGYEVMQLVEGRAAKITLYLVLSAPSCPPEPPAWRWRGLSTFVAAHWHPVLKNNPSLPSMHIARIHGTPVFC